MPNQDTKNHEGVPSSADEVKQANLELTQKLLELETLYDVGMAVTSVLDISVLADEILTRLVSLLDLKAGFLLLRNDDAGPLYTAACFGIEETMIRQLRSPDDADLFEQVMDAGAGQIFNDFGAAHMPCRHLMLVPLRGRKEMLGVLGVLDRESRDTDVAPFTEADKRLVAAFANQAGIAITNARLYRDLQESNRRLEAALEELQEHQRREIQQERLQALGQMASGIAHDFNNALSAILGYTELWTMFPQMLDDRDKVIRNLATINTVAKDAAHIVRRLRGFYRPREEGNVEMPVDLNDVIPQAIDITLPKWKTQALDEGRVIEIVTDMEPTPPIKGDDADLREMFINFIFNAVDAMPEGGTITLRLRNVSQSTGDTPTHVMLEVCDTGVGMTEEVRGQCMEPFFSTKGERGTGMGLAMVFGIIQRHHGTLDIESAPGKGAVFRILFPAWKTRQTSERPADESVLLYSIHVLVVDDDPIQRELMTTFLEKDGHTFETAASGREGLEAFHKGQFDVVITDKMMPEISGDHLARAIKQVAPRKPVILVTGDDVVVDKPIQGVDHSISKPVTLTTVRQALMQVISHTRRT